MNAIEAREKTVKVDYENVMNAITKAKNNRKTCIEMFYLLEETIEKLKSDGFRVHKSVAYTVIFW